MEELGVQEMCTARLFSIKTFGEDSEAQKEAQGEEEAKENKNEAVADPDADEGPEELIGEMASLEALGLQNGGKLEVEVFFSVDV